VNFFAGLALSSARLASS